MKKKRKRCKIVKAIVDTDCGLVGIHYGKCLSIDYKIIG